MAQRILPGAYVSLNDLSQLPEGQTALTVGYVVTANRGPVNELSLVTSPTDFLTKYTFSGKPGVSDDKTFWSILKVLSKTNAMYVSRAANNPLYGGVVLEAASEIGTIVSANKTTKIFTLSTSAAGKVNVGDRIMVHGSTSDKDATNDVDGYYTVTNVNTTKVTVSGDIPSSVSEAIFDDSVEVKMYIAPGASLNSIAIAEIAAITSGGAFQFVGDIRDKFTIGSKFLVKGATTDANNTTFTVETNEESDPISYDEDTNRTTIITTTAAIPGDVPPGTAYYSGLGNPGNFEFSVTGNELLLVTGADPGAYNNDIALKITTSIDFPEDFVYYNGAVVGGKTITFDTMQLEVINSNTNETLETFLFSRDPDARTIDGISLYVDSVVNGSAYIKVINNVSADKALLPSSTFAGPVYPSGGDNGGTVDASVLEAALQPFKDKTTSLSILGNGCSIAAETKAFHQALMSVADDRKDLIVFLNNPYETTEKNVTLGSTRAQKIVDYKKDLGNTSFYGCMYAPHVNINDTFNQRQMKIGAEAVAIAGWLDIIGNLNYPYAYAGPRNGLVQGVTCDWKIGDMSGEAQILNDASVNYVAYDGKVGRYYMQCQNTLQVANSSMRNIGTVFNVLDIKEHFVTLLKEYTQLPITSDLRRDIMDVSNDYLSPMLGVRFSNYSFQDVTTDFDLADNTLRYLLTIAPTPYAQKIYLVMNIVNATFDFSITQSI